MTPHRNGTSPSWYLGEFARKSEEAGWYPASSKSKSISTAK